LFGARVKLLRSVVLYVIDRSVHQETLMPHVRYSVVMSLDGYIAGPKGEADWIPTDPEFDFNALFNQFDTLLVGRRTFETDKPLWTRCWLVTVGEPLAFPHFR